MPACIREGPRDLAPLRAREDDLRQKLDAVRAHLARCVEALRELAALEARACAESASAYRSDATTLDEKLATARAVRDERRRLRIVEANLLGELEQVRALLEGRGIKHVALPILENIAIASPCDVSWSEMEGDGDTRFCNQCQKHVYNLSMMTRAEAETFVARTGGQVCLRLYRRQDGTVLTQDCPAGLRRARFWRRTGGIAAAGLLLAALGALGYAQLAEQAHVDQSAAVQGFGGH